jgi:AcrR family transcriptional regulator
MGRHKEFDVEKTLDKALNVFWKKGFADTSMTDLEEATGLKKPSLYLAFGDKDAVFIASLNRYLDAFDATRVLLRHPLGWHNIENLFRAVARNPGKIGCFASISLREKEILPKKANKCIQAYFARVRQAYAENISAEGCKDASAIVELLQSFQLGMVLSRSLSSGKDQSEAVDRFLAIVGSWIKRNPKD